MSNLSNLKHGHKSRGRPTLTYIDILKRDTGLEEEKLNPNRLDWYKILMRKCIKCDCVITGTPKPKRWPGSDTRWLGLLGHGAGVREVRGSKSGVATTLLLTLFRVR